MMFSITYLRKAIERADIAIVNRMRIVAILLCALVFGVALHKHIFIPNGFVRAQVSAAMQPAVVPENEEPLPDGLQSEEPYEASVSASAAEEEVELPAEEGAGVAVEPPLLSLSATSGLLTGSGLGTIRFQHNSDMRLPIASLTKLMTAVVVTESADFSEYITVSKEAVAQEGTQGGLREGEELSVENLLRVMLVVSSNDAAFAFEEYFAKKGMNLVSRMNEKAIALGMANTHFANASGLDENGHFSTARDLGVLTAYSLVHQNMWDMLSRSEDTVFSRDGIHEHDLVSNNDLIRSGNKAVRGSKTGYTQKAKGCMIAVLSDGAITVVLGSDDRVGDTQKLIELSGRTI